MLPEYIAAFTQTPPEVLRRRLLPFSIGHAYLLEAAGNGFALNAEGGSIDDLAVAVGVCSRGFRDAIRFLNGEVAEDSAKWAEECAGLSHEFEAAKFRQYTVDAITNPKRWKSGEGEALRVPWPLGLFAAMAGDGTITPAVTDQIMDTPLAEAFVINAARQAWAGDKSIYSEEDAKAEKILKELEKANVAS